MNTAGALSDPVRVEILELLRHSPLTAGQVERHFPISRPAVSRHLRVLRETGLVHCEQSGRERVYSLETGPLRELVQWLARFLRDEDWGARFDALETEVQRTRRGRAPPPRGVPA
jgi:DNA-binding transcriptional ArsR family regulator